MYVKFLNFSCQIFRAFSNVKASTKRKTNHRWLELWPVTRKSPKRRKEKQRATANYNLQTSNKWNLYSYSN